MIEHEQYYRKGGTYELPIEIYNDLIGQIEEAQKERNDYKSRCEKANALIQRHNEDTGDIYYKYNNRFLKSELKERLSEILNGVDEK